MRIIIYTRNDCVQCHATRRAMESRGLAFEMVNVDQQPDAADTLREQAIESFQRQIEVDEPEEDVMTLLVANDAPVEDDMSEERLLRALMEAQGEN